MDAYIFLKKARSLASLHYLQREGRLRAVVETVGGDYEVLLAAEVEHLGHLLPLYALVGVDQAQGDVTAIGVPLHPVPLGGFHIVVEDVVLILLVEIASQHHAGFVEHASTPMTAVSALYGGSATHLVEVTAGTLEEAHAEAVRILGHAAVKSFTTSVSSNDLMPGAGPRES